MVSSYCRELCGPLPYPHLNDGESQSEWHYMVRAWRKTRLKSCISKPVFLTAQQSSASTLPRQLEEEEGFGTDSRLQVPGWKRLDKILHCKQYDKLYFSPAPVPWALYFWPHPHWLMNRCTDRFFSAASSWHASSCQALWENHYKLGGFCPLGIRQEWLGFTFPPHFKCKVKCPFRFESKR